MAQEVKVITPAKAGRQTGSQSRHRVRQSSRSSASTSMYFSSCQVIRTEALKAMAKLYLREAAKEPPLQATAPNLSLHVKLHHITQELPTKG